MSLGRLLVLRRAGHLWGVDHTAVHSVERRGEELEGHRVRVGADGGHELAADHVVGVVDDLTVRPAGAVMQRYWTEPAGGMAVLGTTPLVVVDPERPPSFLRSEDTETTDGDDRQA